MWRLQILVGWEWHTLNKGYDEKEIRKKFMQWQQNYFRTETMRVVKGTLQ